MTPDTVQVEIEKLVHGGQGLGTLEDGRKVLVWNALPGETVSVELHKRKNSFAEGVATEVIKASPDRETPRDEAYLSTSPWQIMSFKAEQTAKADILLETFQREHVPISATLAGGIKCVTAGEPWGYRNKMEYSFWGDEDGLHLALFHRASHGKRIITGSSIARPEIDEVAGRICEILNQAGIRGSQLKTVVLRSNLAGECVAALYVKDSTFPELPQLGEVAQGVAVYYSNPKSPASIYTRTLYEYGSVVLHEQILGSELVYNVRSFFQVNIPVFEKALTAIQEHIGGQPVIDYYSGVGSIGVPIGASTFVESDSANIEMLKRNITSKAKIVAASAETALEDIGPKGTLIIDPPRAGLHQRVTDELLENGPATIIYLSCNPITQARDVARLQTKYELTYLQAYNFFPRTPHIESLAVLQAR